MSTSPAAELPIGVVVNPRAALGRGRRTGRRIAELLRAQGQSVTIISRADTHACAQELGQLAPRVRGFLLVGGDGLLSTFLQVPAARALPFAVIPAGSGNDFAREFGVPRRNPSRALQHALAGTSSPRIIDALVVTTPDGSERWVGCGVSFGLDARINRRANAIGLPLGPLRYQIALVVEILLAGTRTFSLEVDGVRSRYPGLLTTVMNTRTLGGGIPITPDADPADGLLDVILVTPASKRRLLSVLGLLSQGKHTRIPEVKIVRGRRVRVASDGEIAFADGERVGEGPLDIRIAEGALQVWA